MNIYVGNLSFTANESDLSSLFERFGAVSNSSIISDKFTGRSRGFGFVEMEVEGEARQAIESLHGSDLKGRQLVVNEARAREEGGAQRRPMQRSRYNDDNR